MVMKAKSPTELLAAHGDRVSRCRRCPRLVEWREACAADPPRRYRDDAAAARQAPPNDAGAGGHGYWARPVPGFGDPAARVVVVGLAPAAHGANRTGRMFTGDRSGQWLYAALHHAGFANQPSFEHRDDGLVLADAWITAVVRCAPPANRPSTTERDSCLPWLEEELGLLTRARVVLALGAFAWDGALRALRALGHPTPRPKPRFGHGAEAEVGTYRLLGSFHPSQQNTFTGKLTEPMLDAVLDRARELAGGPG